MSNDQIEKETERVFRGLVTAWVDRDMDAVMAFMAENISRTINLDGEVVPFASNVSGKAAMRERLQKVLDTFEVASYVTDVLRIEGAVARAQIRCIYIHFDTGERLSLRFRFVIEQRDGLIVRTEAIYDRGYVEAFFKLVEAMRKT